MWSGHRVVCCFNVGFEVKGVCGFESFPFVKGDIYER